jgi:DNA repair exonuclease SbcCD ATPase subunit
MSTTPNVPGAHESERYENAGTPRWIIAVLIVLVAAVVVVAYVGYSGQSKLEAGLAKAQDQNKLLTQQLDQANARLAEVKGHVDITEQKLGMTQADLARAKSRAEEIRKEQVAADQRQTAQLSQVKQESEEKIGAVATEVGGAKKDIADTRTDLEATKSKLERALGDMGVMSGLIARNQGDLEELKRRGERNYFEFTLAKAKSAERVGPIQLKLEKADAKKQRYTLTVFADDKSIEKKDKTAGEPVQFLLKGAARSAPYEIVVFEVTKDKVTGYLSTPKEAAAVKPQS